MIRIIFEFLGGPNDGKSVHGDSGDGGDAGRFHVRFTRAFPRFDESPGRDFP